MEKDKGKKFSLQIDIGSEEGVPFSRLCSAAMALRGTTANGLAAAVGVSTQTVHRWTTQKASSALPERWRVPHLALALGLDYQTIHTALDYSEAQRRGTTTPTAEPAESAR